MTRRDPLEADCDSSETSGVGRVDAAHHFSQQFSRTRHPHIPPFQRRCIMVTTARSGCCRHYFTLYWIL